MNPKSRKRVILNIPLIILSATLFGITYIKADARDKDSIYLKLVYNDSAFYSLPGFRGMKSIYFLKDTSEMQVVLQKSSHIFLRKGFLAFNIDSIVGTQSHYYAYLYTGNQYFWGKLSADSCDDQVANKIFRKYCKYGKPLSIGTFHSVQSAFVNYYENHGYPFAKVSFVQDIDNTDDTENSLSGRFVLKKNQLVTIDSFVIKGNVKISESYIYRYLGIKKDDLFVNKEIQQIDSKLNQLKFARVIKPSQIEFVNNTADIYVYLDKRKSNHFNALVGLVPENEETGKLLLTGSLDLLLINSIHRGDQLSISWNKTETNSQRLSIGFAYPYLFNTSLGISGSFKLFRQDTIYQTISPIIALHLLYNGNNYVKVFYNYQSTSIITTSGFGNLTKLPSFADVSNQYYGLGYSQAKLDNLLNPSTGYSVMVEASYGSKQIHKNSELNEALYDSIVLKTNQLKVTTELEYYQPIWRRFTFAVRNSSGILQNQNLFENELFRLGGVNNLRGFDDESVYASSFTIFNFELRYLYATDSHVFIFFDQAYYERKLYNSEKINDTPYGFGAGINLEVRAGILSLSYALGKQFDNPISLKNGKIHIGFISQF